MNTLARVVAYHTDIVHRDIRDETDACSRFTTLTVRQRDNAFAFLRASWT